MLAERRLEIDAIREAVSASCTKKASTLCICM